MNGVDIDILIAVAHKCSYTVGPKGRFRSLSIQLMRAIARSIELPLGETRIRHHAGPAGFSGETSLVHPDLWLHVDGDSSSPDFLRILGRTRRGIDNPIRANNRWFLLRGGSEQEIERLVVWVKRLHRESLEEVETEVEAELVTAG